MVARFFDDSSAEEEESGFNGFYFVLIQPSSVEVREALAWKDPAEEPQKTGAIFQEHEEGRAHLPLPLKDIIGSAWKQADRKFFQEPFCQIIPL